MEFGTPKQKNETSPDHFSGEKQVGDVIIKIGYNAAGNNPEISLEGKNPDGSMNKENILLGQDDNFFSENMFKYGVDLLSKLQGEGLSIEELAARVRHHVQESEQKVAIEKEYQKRVDPETGEEWENN